MNGWEIPGVHSHELMVKRTQQVARAMDRVNDDLGYDISKATKVGPAELARGGYKKVHTTRSKLVEEKELTYSRHHCRMSGKNGL